MIQTVTFGTDFRLVDNNYKLIGKNTYDDWKLLATIRPVVSPPTQKTNYINISGGDGILDLSESLTKYPVYNNRTGNFQFRILNVNRPWYIRYSEIMEYLHGKYMKIVLEDDPAYFYQGRINIDGYGPGATWSIININIDVGPYKWSTLFSVDDWLWNMFNFEIDVINKALNSSNINNIFKNIIVNSTTTWLIKTFSNIYIGPSPISPVFIVTEAGAVGSNSELKVRYINNILNIDKTITLINGQNEIPDIIFYGLSEYKLEFIGVGVINISFRKGRL